MASLFFPIIVIGILSLLTSVDIAQGELMESIVKCCTEGRLLGSKGSCQDIVQVMSTVQVLQRSRPICDFIGTVCCENALRDMECAKGVTAARTSSAACDSAESDDFLKCCEVCKTGLEVGREDGGDVCELRETTLGLLYDSVFVQCCHAAKPPDGTSEGNQPTEQDVCSLLRGELCAHICTPTAESFRCSCRPGYKLMSDGVSCSPSSMQSCEGCSHSCEEQPTGTVCTCPAGLTLGADNMTCTDVEDNTMAAPLKCPRGYRPKTNQTCQDIDECTEGISTCNSASERCVNTIGSYNCIGQCNRGFQYNDYHQTCEDINECNETDDPPCDSNQECENTVGSFVCHCKPGFKQDPITYACIDVNECQQRLHDCGQFQRCDNTLGSYVCVRDINCGTGYTLNSQSGKCEDDDECMLGTDTCRFLGSEWECRNTQGSFRCVKKQNTSKAQCTSSTCSQHLNTRTCPSGFRASGDNCVDINECEEGTSRCSPDQRCVNIQGYYLCSNIVKCKPGFKLNEDRSQCTDINECEEQEGLCMHICENRWGSYRCRCNKGFSLASDNRTCLDINECELGIRCQGYCVNEQGSYSCQCPPGYTLGHNRHTCLDINECTRSPDVCQPDTEECVNIPGSYRCGSVECPPGYHKDSNRRLKCIKEIRCASWDDEECLRQPAMCSFNFISMVSNLTIPRNGFINLFVVESSLGATSPDFSLELRQARVPPGVEAATRSNFNLHKQYGRAVLQLVKPLYGPQDIQLEMKTEFYSKNVFHGSSLHNIEIYVSQYTF